MKQDMLPDERSEEVRRNQVLYEKKFTVKSFAGKIQKIFRSDQIESDFGFGYNSSKAIKNSIDQVEVSVIVPVYNVEGYLHDCLRSLSVQHEKTF